jgi:GT2 family glycosyltransferase
MIPTCNPRLDHLEQALSGVLDQLGAGATAQIELVDDASDAFDVRALVQTLGSRGVAVTCHRNQARLGLPGNWNQCIRRARGEWIHILHQDDFVLAGFYDAIRVGLQTQSSIGAAFCDTYFADRRDRMRQRTKIPRTTPGILTDWYQHVFVQLAIQTAAIVVRRSVYEALGGFDDNFQYVADWDMWKRIAVKYPIWYDPRPLACYRMHAGSQTARLRAEGRNIGEIAASIEHSELLLPSAVGPAISRRARRAYAVFAVENVLESLLHERAPHAAYAQLLEAVRMSSFPAVARAAGWIVLRTLARPIRRLPRAARF